MSKQLYNELLYWIHVGIVLVFFLLSFYLPFLITAGLAILHKIHICFFNDCVISHLQRASGGLSKQENFYQAFFRRTFNKNLTKKETTIVHFTVMSTCLTISFIHTYFM